MEANQVSDYLGSTSNRFRNSLYTVSIVEYTHFVSEDWHYHENFHLSSILTGGNNESRKSGDIEVEPGRIMTYQEGEYHRNRNTVFPSKNLNVEFSHEFFSDKLKFSNLQLSADAYLSMLKVYHELMISDVYSSQSVDQIISSIFLEDNSTSKPKWIDTLKTLLNDRWQEFVSLEELSNELGLHPVSISKYFAKHSKCTLADYMRIIKVNRAVHMIINLPSSLTEIAYKCGFSDQSHMNRLFKHYIGFSPLELRKF